MIDNMVGVWGQQSSSNQPSVSSRAHIVDYEQKRRWGDNDVSAPNTQTDDDNRRAGQASTALTTNHIGCERTSKVFEKIKELVKPRSNVTPLNVAGKRYARIFDSAPPQHLGIALLVLLPEGIGPERSYHIVPYLKAAFQTMKALMEVKSVAAELKPNGVSKIYSQCIGVEIPHGFLGESVTAAFPDEIVGLPTVVFFDADRKIDMNRLTGLAMAVRVIERLAFDTDSYEPADHRKVSMLAADATQYRKSVEDIYDKGIGVWSRELLPYYHAWRNGLHAHLEMRPVVTAMLSSLAATPTPTELHFKVPDEYAILAKQK